MRRTMRLLGLAMAFVAFHLVTDVHGEGSYVNRSLLLDILLPPERYNTDVLPICEEDGTVNITLSLELRQIIELSNKERRLQTRVWMHLSWQDCRLTWNFSEHGISKIHIPFNRVWTPDLTLFRDRLTDTSLSTQEKYPLTVQNDGTVFQSFPASTDTACDINVHWFPFDVQSCQLEFGSWVYDDSLLSLTYRNTDNQNNYVASGEWTFCLMEPKKTIRNTETGSYSSLEYHVAMKRQPVYFIIMLLVPAFLIGVLSICGFFLPPSKIKLELQVTILVALTVFQTMTLDTIPADSSPIPQICLFFMFLMILVGISCAFTMIIIKVMDKAERGRRPGCVSKWCLKRSKACLSSCCKPCIRHEELIVAHLKVPYQEGVVEKLHPLYEGSNVIGKDDNCDVCIPSKSLSEQHACIKIRGDSHKIKTCNRSSKSKHGRIDLLPKQPYTLTHNERLVFADVHASYVIVKEMEPEVQVVTVDQAGGIKTTSIDGVQEQQNNDASNQEPLTQSDAEMGLPAVTQSEGDHIGDKAQWISLASCLDGIFAILIVVFLIGLLLWIIVIWRIADLELGRWSCNDKHS